MMRILKNQIALLLLLLTIGFSSCEDKGYSITYEKDYATIYQYGARQCEREEREIFDELQSSKYNGQYTIYYCRVDINNYGEKSYGEPFELVVVDATKIKHTDYEYFKGTIADCLSNLYSINYFTGF